MARRRGLGDVLQYFIPEEEQREARARAQANDATPSASPAAQDAPLPRGGRVRWCIPSSPRRPLSCAFALDLAAALQAAGPAPALVAPFGPAFLRPSSASLDWRELPRGEEGAELAQALADRSDFLLLLPPEDLERALTGLPSGFLDGILLPVDASQPGIEDALAFLRHLSREARALRVGVVLIGAPSPEAAARLFQTLEGAARRQLLVAVERVGDLRRDQSSFRALLRGVPVQAIDPAAGSARDLEALVRRLSS